MALNNLFEFIVSMMYSIMEWGNDILLELSEERTILGFDNPISLLEIMFGVGIGLVIVRVIKSFFG